MKLYVRLNPKLRGFRRATRRVGNVDQATVDFLNSTAPAPTQESLSALLARVTRVRVIGAGMVEDRAMPGPVLLETSAADQLTALRTDLAIVDDPAGFGHCLCFGWPTIELFEGRKLRAALGLHHGRTIRWNQWKGDAPLAHPVALLRWMADLGATGPLSKFEQDRARAEAEIAEWERWLAAVPASLAPFRSGFEAWTQGTAQLDVSEMLKALAVEFPDAGQRVRALLVWFGKGSGRWNGYPEYEAIPEQFLLALDTRQLLGALEERAPTPEEAEGAARFFAGWEFQKARRAEIETFPPELRALLLEAGSRTTDADRIARTRAAFADG